MHASTIQADCWELIILVAIGETYASNIWLAQYRTRSVASPHEI
jgi:hypothetical protein